MPERRRTSWEQAESASPDPAWVGLQLGSGHW
jgi:hypothetical protein